MQVCSRAEADLRRLFTPGLLVENVCSSEKTKELPISQALSVQVYQSQPFPIPCCKSPALVKFLASEEKQTRTHLSLREAEATLSPSTQGKTQ